MRRAIAFLLMYLVPLQYTWAAASLHVHPDEVAAGEFLHIGDHEAADTAVPDEDGGEHDHHCHHVPSLSILDSGVPAGIPAPAQPDAAAAGAHASHIPPVRDRPPRGAA